MLHNRVKELRARFGFTQGDLGERVGVTRQTISFIEKGDFSPSVSLALKIAREFEIKVDELFWLEGDRKT
ncbi:helix-turn-helix transcriptional regulator [Paenisporosarcina sp. TG20]|uniref:helix-turn-helix transcriptional regulator n=1 Tax=Paenisporosarcina sp. TG20 TaxID=1211706 RepID=UPI000311D9E5|nr:helix-turn-helix transcriptional regulator [Paenisporosarcina sp. TG20]